MFHGAALTLSCALPVTCSLHGPLAFAGLPVTCTVLSGGRVSLYFYYLVRDGLNATFRENTSSDLTVEAEPRYKPVFRAASRSASSHQGIVLTGHTHDG